MVKPGGDKIVLTAGQFAQYPAPNETPAYYCVNLIIRQTSAYPGKNRDGAVMIVLASYQHSPGSMLAGCHIMWVEFVLGALRVFLRVLWFLFLHKNQCL